MGDGSLNQDEIDALLQGADDSAASTAANAQEKPEINEAVKRYFFRLSETLPDKLKGVLAGNASIKINSVIPFNESSIGTEEMITRSTIEFNSGNAACIIGFDSVRMLARLMTGQTELELPDENYAFNDAQQSVMDDFFNAFWNYFPQPENGGEIHFASPENIYNVLKNESLSSTDWFCCAECLLTVSDFDSGGALIDIIFFILLDKAAAEIAEPVTDTVEIPEINSKPEDAVDISVKNWPFNLQVKLKQLFFMNSQLKKPLSCMDYMDFYQNVLTAKEKTYISGDKNKLTWFGKRRAVKKIRENAAILYSGNSVRTENDNPKMNFPLTVRFEDRVLKYSDISPFSDNLPDMNYFAGKTGSLLLGDKEIAMVRLVNDKTSGPSVEIIKNNISGGIDDFKNKILGYSINLSVELGRTVLSPDTAAQLKEGSIIELDKPAGAPVDLIMEEYGHIRAKGEVVTVDERYGIRITDILPMPSGHAAGNSVENNFSSEPGMPVRCILGRTRMTLNDIAGFGEGSIIELDNPAGTPVDLLIGEETVLKAEVVVIDENFGVRVLPDENEDSDDIFKGELKSPEPELTAAIGGIEPDEDMSDYEPVAESAPFIGRDETAEDRFPELSNDELIEKARQSVNEQAEYAVYAMNKMLETGNRIRAAEVMIALGAEAAAPIMAGFDDDAQESLTFEIARIDLASLNECRISLSVFFGIIDIRANSLPGGIDYARDVLEKGVGTGRAIEIVNNLTSSLQVVPFDFVKRTDPYHLLNFLQGEHPQTIALVLSYLDSSKAALILSGLGHQIQADVTQRIALMDRTSPDVLREVERVLERKLSTLASEDYTSAGGIDAVVDIINNVDRGTEKIIIEAIEEDDPELAEEIKKRLFVFEDIVLLDDRSIQKVLREVDTQDLAKALKGVDAEVQEKVFRNMSKRAGSLLREDMDFMGPIRLRDVQESQQKIVNIISKLEESGDIIVAHSGGEELVV